MPKFRPKPKPAPPEPVVVEVRDPKAVPAKLLRLYDEADEMAEAVIEARVSDLKRTATGVPEGCIRQDITRHETDRAALMRRWSREDEVAKAKAAEVVAEVKG
jgi:hypothetical protein